MMNFSIGHGICSCKEGLGRYDLRFQPVAWISCLTAMRCRKSLQCADWELVEQRSSCLTTL
jgi:hypothetical protein